jgi:serine/threonine-protein kinase
MKGSDGLYARPWIDRGLAHASRALEKEPNSARALEQRGTLRYWRWLLHLEPGASASATLLGDAEKDLRSAVQRDPSLAGAWSALSHLDYQKSDIVQAKIDAQRAYEADAYYGAADTILWRLFSSSYDLGQFLDAAHWCEEGERRFPGTLRVVQCELLVLTSRGKDPDVPQAWRLLDQLAKVTPPDIWPFEKLKAQMLVAAVITRAGLPDSARGLLLRSRGNRDIDPGRDLLYNEAFVRTMLGDRDEAIRLLKEYISAQPERRADLSTSYEWWFRDLQSDPRYRELVGTDQ